MSERFGLRGGDLPRHPWLEVLSPDVRLGLVRHALFDFDGTISVIRRGWEQVMIPLMVEMIVEGSQPTDVLRAEVEDYVDRSTGVLTIKQMQWLERAVRRHGRASCVLPAHEYKRIYNERLLNPVRERMAALDGSESARDELMIAGARQFLQRLAGAGVALYLASGTDHEYVMEETTALGVAHFFGDHIYGARDDTEAYTKERITGRILDENDLHGVELAVIGDGPVEIQHARSRGAVALGVAADEYRRQGLNVRKRQRLAGAGADLIVTDFLHAKELAAILAGETREASEPQDLVSSNRTGGREHSGGRAVG